MHAFQAAFQASFDARVERLDDVEQDELRAVFRFFDTDGDGAVAATQACRMFALLGLDVNDAQVLELGEVYLAEFLKIVDSHVPAPFQRPAEPDEMVPTPTPPLAETEPQEHEQNVEAALERARPLWEAEWKLLDVERRGRVTRAELTRFLESCELKLPPADLRRFLEGYGDPTSKEVWAEQDELTRAGFLKFRRDYTAAELAHSAVSEASSDDDHDGDAGPHAAVEVTARGPRPVERDAAVVDAVAASRHSNRPASDRLDSVHDHKPPADPSAFHGSDASDGNDGAGRTGGVSGAHASAVGHNPLV